MAGRCGPRDFTQHAMIDNTTNVVRHCAGSRDVIPGFLLEYSLKCRFHRKKRSSHFA